MASSLAYGRVLAVAADGRATDPCVLRVAVAAAAERASQQRLRLSVLATYSDQSVWRTLLATSSVHCVGALIPSSEDLQADVQRRVMKILAAVDVDIALSWRCVAEPPCAELVRELASGPDALVVVGCSGTWSSRRLAHKLVLTAERCGSLAMICRPEVKAPVLASRGATSTDAQTTDQFL